MSSIQSLNQDSGQEPDGKNSNGQTVRSSEKEIGGNYFVRNIRYTHNLELESEPEGFLSYRVCEKNPGHNCFIPIRNLTKDHLPCDWKSDEMFEYIMVLSRITVRVRGNFVSSNRPECLLVGDMKPGQKLPASFGTGYVCMEPDRHPVCGCGDCEPDAVGYRICIRTAAHVVFDASEVIQAEVEFYLDDDIDKSSVLKLSGFEFDYNDIDGDICKFVCVTHDEEVYKRILKDWETVMKLRKTIRGYINVSPPPYYFIISHPHGYAKHVSFGDKTEKMQQDMKFYYRYNVPTCAGSSGAHTFGIGYDGVFALSWFPHHGHDKKNETFNRTGYLGDATQSEDSENKKDIV